METSQSGEPDFSGPYNSPEHVIEVLQQAYETDYLGEFIEANEVGGYSHDGKPYMEVTFQGEGEQFMLEVDRLSAVVFRYMELDPATGDYKSVYDADRLAVPAVEAPTTGVLTALCEYASDLVEQAYYHDRSAEI